MADVRAATASTSWAVNTKFLQRTETTRVTLFVYPSGCFSSDVWARTEFSGADGDGVTRERESASWASRLGEFRLRVSPNWSLWQSPVLAHAVMAAAQSHNPFLLETLPLYASAPILHVSLGTNFAYGWW